MQISVTWWLGDPSPDGEGTLLIKRGIEVGHVFSWVPCTAKH
ncbi:hypothetical protein ACULNC_23060 [Shigella flexneri]